MSKYIGDVNIDNTMYRLSANYATSALTAGIASSYTFDTNVEIFDDYVSMILDHPFKYSNTAVTSLPATSVYMTNNVYASATTLNVYSFAVGQGLNQVAIANAVVNVMPTYNAPGYDSHNSHYTETIEGTYTQTARYTEQETVNDWIVPVKFKVASYYDMQIMFEIFESSPNATGVSVTDPTVTAALTIQGRPISTHYQVCETKQIWGTTIPAVLFNEANLANISFYDESDTNYKLNTQILTPYGNIGHIDDVSNNEFVKFSNNLQNVVGLEIVSGTVKKNSYATTARVFSALDSINDFDIATKPYSVFTANVNDNVGCGILQNTAINYAFYDNNGNYKAITTNDDTIYDEYTLYCKMPAATYSTTADATAAVQSVIDARSYAAANIIGSRNAYYDGHGTIANNAQVFNTSDFVMGENWTTAKYVKIDDLQGYVLNCSPISVMEGGIHAWDVTAVRADSLYRYRDISTLITKPVIDTSNIQHIQETTYTYAFDALYTLNDINREFNSMSNYSVYKAATFNTIKYQNAAFAPENACLNTYFPNAGIMSNYYNSSFYGFRTTAVPTATISDVNLNLLPISDANYLTATTLYSPLPTRDIHYCITLSK